MPFDRDRAQDDVTNYEPEWKALAWEVHEILAETRAFNRAQMLRLAKLGALDHWLASSPRRLTEDEIAGHVTASMMDSALDHLEGDLAERVAECA